MMERLTLIISIITLVMAVLFIIILIQNTHVVTLRLFFWKIGMSQIIDTFNDANWPCHRLHCCQDDGGTT